MSELRYCVRFIASVIICPQNVLRGNIFVFSSKIVGGWLGHGNREYDIAAIVVGQRNIQLRKCT